MPAPTENAHFRERVAQLFQYLKAYIDLRNPPVREISKQKGIIWLKDIPPHPAAELHPDYGTIEDGDEDSDIVLNLSRPELAPCPPPPPALLEWLKPNWRDLSRKAEVLNTRNVMGENGETKIERFEDDVRRQAFFRAWRKERDQWDENERPAREAMAIFLKIYEWYGVAEREGEKIEFLIADGLLRCNAPDGIFDHPILLQKIGLEFYPEKPQPQFVFRRREQPPELYLELLRVLPGVNIEQLSKCAKELRQAEFTPLGDGGTTGFLRRLIQGAFPEGGTLIENALATHLIAAPSETPTIERQPVIFMRQRRTGLSNVFEHVLEDVATCESFSPALLQMLGLVETTQVPDDSVSDGLPSGNEDDTVLLGKPANREQLEIARQLGRRDCVLVQGPPGTGKTHTIANLLGHLLAQGKRVLVTAHSPKALRVLRQKVIEPLQPLCVSVLQNDKQSQEELQASVRKIHLRLSEDSRVLERQADNLRAERLQILTNLREFRDQLLDARQDEIRDVVVGGQAIRPIEAAKQVKAGEEKHDWVPAPVELGTSLPLTHSEIVELYQTNARVSSTDERELIGKRFDLDSLPIPNEFKRAVDESTSLAAQNLRLRAELWNDASRPDELTTFDRMLEQATQTIDFLKESATWQLEAIQAGRDGEHARRVWESLAQLIETACQEAHECHALVMEHGPVISDSRSPHELLAIVDEILHHAQGGGSFGLLTKLTKQPWFALRNNIRIGTRELVLSEVIHLQAVRALLRIRQLRSDLIDRWERQMAQCGGIPSTELGERPEQVCKQFVPKIRGCLTWHETTWSPLESEFERLGFSWSAFLESTSPESGDNAELRRIRRAVTDELAPVLQSRVGYLRQKRLHATFRTWRSTIHPVSAEPEAHATQRLRRALLDSSPTEYESAYNELTRLKRLEADLDRRHSLLRKLAQVAPAWASAVENRTARHGTAEPPGDPWTAWDWRQLNDELDRRAEVSLDQLQQRIERLGQQLFEITGQLIDKQTWTNQIRQTGSAQKQALGAYAAMRNKLTKSGTGVRDPELRAAARREMALAKDAVPVWIMPIPEVAENFDPRTTRFDVVIIDEASQCDPTSLFAVYLGRQTIIVGDDEQVTPVVIDGRTEEVSKLMRVFLQGVPQKELYDGETSIYELAQIAFGGVIRLTEHFRCAPSIIAFSNELSYGNAIKPLREASSIPLRSHVVPYRVRDGRDRDDKVNENEAEAVASLVCAAIQQPEYATNDEHKPTTFGAVSLVGDKQALKIDAILRQRLPPIEYRRRKILCGASAEFQGDERDVIFLSMVDSPPEQPPLSMRQEGPKKIFKKRFNVAASRARNQMWVVHSLNYESDLQPGDYRHRLIAHSIDPHAYERELRRNLAKVDSRSRVFEGAVLRH